MNNFIILLIISLIMYLVELLHIPSGSIFINDSTMALGFLILAAYYGGRITNMLTMPRITGYIIIGVLFGPWVLKFVTLDHLTEFKLINELALALIAFNAGVELNIGRLKARIRNIVYTIILQAVFTMTLMVAAIFAVRPFIREFHDLPTELILGMSLIIGVISIAKSPSQTIAVLVETRAKGKLTDTVLGVTMLIDIVVIIMFTIIISAVKPLMVAGSSMNFGSLATLGAELLLSVAAGVGFGYLIVLYFRFVRHETLIFILGMAFFITILSHQLHFEFLLACMTTGFFVENYSNKGHEFLKAVERGSLPIYLIFFSIAGAALNLPILFSLWPLALLIVITRLIAIYFGTYLSGRATKESSLIRHRAWSGFISQAGVSLGFAILVKAHLPDVGELVTNMVIAAVVINMIIGPILFKWALQKAGETRLPGKRRFRKFNLPVQTA